MPRRRRPQKRIILPDPKFKDQVVAKFINGLMFSGKKSIAEKIFYDAMDIVENRTKKAPIDVFKKAMENVAPILEVKSRRVGGATYQVPVEVRANRRQALAIRWLIRYSTARSEMALLLKSARTPIRWQKQIKHLHILGGRIEF